MKTIHFEKLVRMAVVVGFLSPLITSAQKFTRLKVTEPIICYAAEHDHPLTVPAPAEYLAFLKGARVKTSTINVTFGSGFPEEGMTAINKAVEIWESLINSSVPINVSVEWASLQSGTLASANYTNLYANFPGAQKLNVFYPVALAERIAGEDFNAGEADIFARFNSNVNWHYDPATGPPAGKYDLVTVALHEIGHGLGFSSSFRVDGSDGRVGVLTTSGNRVPVIYDVGVFNGSGTALIEGFPSPSALLGTQLTSQNINFISIVAGQLKLYAPATYNPGSSISHLDEVSFSGDNALMTPNIAASERILNPGVALTMLKDLGWETTQINHTPHPNVENTSGTYTIVATIAEGAVGYDNTSVKLHYTTDGTTFSVENMLATGNPNEFSADIIAIDVAATYGYFISVNDSEGREFLNPGKFVRPGNTQLQSLHTFDTGPDTEAPKITHHQKPFLLTTENQLSLTAKVSDNIGIQSVVVSYFINDVQQPDENLLLVAPEEDSLYEGTISFGIPLQDGDLVTYSITVTDNSSNNNTAIAPADGLYTLNVVELRPTQDTYTNDFDAPSDDFAGNGFSIATPNGFSSGALHTNHPYLEGNGFPGDQLDLVYQLKIPIRVKSQEAFIKFDEIVLVEPGESGAPFGTDDFYDYVVVEGSADGGVTWTDIEAGYDSRANSTWLSTYNSAITGNNSTAVGTSAMYFPRTLDLQKKFDKGDEVVIRFRLHSDPFAAGWGWAIENLKIQIDDNAPVVFHDHFDYMVDSTPELAIKTKATDASGIKALNVEFSVNDGDVETIEFAVNAFTPDYTLNLDVTALSLGDVLHYRIVAIDSAGLIGYFPPSGEFLDVPVIEFGAAVTTYANNFDAGTTDFVGNFFSVNQPAEFSNGAIHSTHFYPTGLGFSGSSDFVTILKQPVKLSASNSYLRFDQIVLVEGHSVGVPFGTDNFKDYVVVEGSKDDGNTWLTFLDGYDVVGQADWISAFNAKSNGTPALFKTKTIDMLASGNFAANDEVIIRFRLFSNSATNGWGWAIDNLYIQDLITDSDHPVQSSIEVYPNPFARSLVLHLDKNSPTKIQIMNIQGQVFYDHIFAESGVHTIDTIDWASGLYYVKASNGQSNTVVKVMKSK